MHETSQHPFFKLTKTEVVFWIMAFTGLYSSSILDHMRSSDFEASNGPVSFCDETRKSTVTDDGYL